MPAVVAPSCGVVRPFWRLCVVALVCLVAACAPKTVPLPVVSSPKYPDFLRPVVAPADAASAAGIAIDRGWTFLQAGDLRNAEHELSSALHDSATVVPAEVSLGYVELARRDGRAALPHFDRALEKQPEYVPALVGRGQALVALEREADALVAFTHAVALDPSLTEIARRVEVLKFRGLEQNLAAARQAARSGRLDEAERAYAGAIASSPDSAFLYRELAAVERQKGEPDAALSDFKKAITHDPGDRASHVQIGDILAERNDFDGAVAAYNAALALEPGSDVDEKLEAVRARAAVARLPDEYRAIDMAAQITRADLAALIGVRLPQALHGAQRRNGVVITDVRDNWASTWIVDVATAGVMEPFANHTFQPRALVTRADLAEVVMRLLAVVANPAMVRAWEAARVTFADLPAGHLAYRAASTAVAAGVMRVGAGNMFEPSKPVSGAEAGEALARVIALQSSIAPARQGRP